MAVAVLRLDGKQVALGLTCMLLLVASAAAKDILVGGSNGWTLIGIDANTYQSQMDTAGAQVGDVLVFSHSGSHTVMSLPSQSALLACDTSQGQIRSPAADAIGTSAYNFTLSGLPGTTFFFICSISTHCPSGMRFNVTVSAVGAPAPAPAPAPLPAGSPTPASSPTTTPAPSPAGTPLASPPPATPTPASSPTPAPAPNGASISARGTSVAGVVALVAAFILGA
eukprot:jgi/Chlat1/5566/Chrsp369S05356